jgi:hypothetical protein
VGRLLEGARELAIADETASGAGGPNAVRLTSPAQVSRFTRYLANS